MDAAQPDGLAAAGYRDRPWYPRFWTGMPLGVWLGVMARNRWRITPGRIPMAITAAATGVVNSAMGLVQHWRYDRRIAATAISPPPVFIIGHWRTGTTFLHELFAIDPQMRCPDTYACFAPKHFLVSRRLVTSWLKYFLPSRRPTDTMPVGWHHPQEDEFALCNLGVPSPYLSMVFPNRPPVYDEYYDLRRVPVEACRHWAAALQHFYRSVLLEKPGRLVLKSPTHAFRIATLRRLFPGALFVHMVRNPYDVFASTLALWHRLQRDQGLQRPRYVGLEERVLATCEHMYQCSEEDRRLLAPGQICDVRYESLVADPVGEMRRIYEALGLGAYTLTTQALARAFPQYAAHTPARHTLSATQRAAVATRWRFLFERYGYSLTTA